MKFYNLILPDNPLEEIKKSWEVNGYTHGDFEIQNLWKSIPRNSPDIPNAFGCRKASLWKREYPLTGSFVYPPGGGMSWHTNSNNPGLRIYLSWSENGDSGMGWLDAEGNLKLDYDEIGWNIRVFNVPTWHCVFSNCWRCSLGAKPC